MSKYKEVYNKNKNKNKLNMENINDIILKSKLLFNYDTKKTLTENVNENLKSNELEEGVAELAENLSSIRLLANSSDDVLRAMGGKVLSQLGGTPLKTTAGVAIKNGDEFLNAIRGIGPTLNRKAMSDLAKSLMKMTPSPSGSLRQSLTSKAADIAIKDARYAAKNGDELANTLKSKGYQNDIAEEIGKKFDAKKARQARRGGGNQPQPQPQPGPGPGPGPGPVPNPPLNPNNLNGIKSVLGKHWKYIEEMYRKGATRAYVRKWAIGMGLSVVAFMMFWNWLTGDNKKHKCPVGYYWDGENCIKIPVPDNDCPAGTYWNGTKCVPRGPVPPPKVCRDFPYTMGCKSPIIAEVQDCLKLTADGIFGPKTLSGLQNGGYGNSITKEVYDKIKANCGKTDDNTTTTTTSDIVNVEDGNTLKF